MHFETIKNLFKPYSNRVYIVGGYIRDELLNISSIDIDIEVYDINIELFESLMDSIGATGVGKSFFVYKYHNIDISLPRTENKVSHGHKGFTCKVINDEKIASKRRDFTMNSLMKNIYTNNILDFWGGIEDIKNKQIRLIDEEKFKEDSLRVLRAIQFSSRFKFKIENNTCNIMQNIMLNDLSKERVFIEFEKMFCSDYQHYGFYYLVKLGVFKKIFKQEITNYQIILFTLAKNGYKEQDIKKLYFLYILYKYSNINIDNLHISKSYKQCFTHSIIDIKTKDDLLDVAYNIPIKKWLGNYNKGIKTLAMDLNIWDNKYTNNINIQDVIKDGFKGKEIIFEYKNRVFGRISK